MLSAIRFIFYTELLLAFRRSQDWLYPIAFFVIVITLFPIAFSPDPVFMQTYLPGCVWIAALFASLLSLQTILFRDKEDSYIEQMRLSQIPLSILVLTKIAAYWLINCAPLIITTFFLSLLLGLSLQTALILSNSLLLGTPIIALLGCLAVTITQGLNQQGALIGLIIFPLIFPILIFGVLITQQSSLGISGPLAFLACLAIFSITLLPLCISYIINISD